VEPLITQADAATYLHVGERTLERWRVTGTGPEYVKVGKKVFYTAPLLVEFVDKCQRQSTKAA
jgi:hypothetical protein